MTTPTRHTHETALAHASETGWDDPRTRQTAHQLPELHRQPAADREEAQDFPGPAQDTGEGPQSPGKVRQPQRSQHAQHPAQTQPREATGAERAWARKRKKELEELRKQTQGLSLPLTEEVLDVLERELEEGRYLEDAQHGAHEPAATEEDPKRRAETNKDEPEALATAPAQQLNRLFKPAPLNSEGSKTSN